MFVFVRVSELKECFMSGGNLAKVFGPTIVGYSVTDPEAHMILMQTADQQMVSTLSPVRNRHNIHTYVDKRVYNNPLSQYYACRYVLDIHICVLVSIYSCEWRIICRCSGKTFRNVSTIE